MWEIHKCNQTVLALLINDKLWIIKTLTNWSLHFYDIEQWFYCIFETILHHFPAPKDLEAVMKGTCTFCREFIHWFLFFCCIRGIKTHMLWNAICSLRAGNTVLVLNLNVPAQCTVHRFQQNQLLLIVRGEQHVIRRMNHTDWKYALRYN